MHFLMPEKCEIVNVLVLLLTSSSPTRERLRPQRRRPRVQDQGSPREARHAHAAAVEEGRDQRVTD